MKKHIVTYCPFYDLTSPVLLTAMNVVDIRSVRTRLERAGVPIREMGGREVVLLEDLLASLDTKAYTRLAEIKPQSALSEKLIE